MARSRSTADGTPIGSLLRMRSLGTLGFLAVLAFYVAWPLYAGYEIRSALDDRSPEGLTARIDFASVRVSLKPAVAAKVDQVLTDALRRGGAVGSAVSDSLKARVMPRVVEAVLNGLVTPEMLIRIHLSGKSLKEALDGVVLEQAAATQGTGGIMILSGGESEATRSRIAEIAGALGIDAGKALEGAGGGKDAAPAVESAAAPRPKYGLGNIKHFSLTGPLGLSVGVARNAAAQKPELTAEMRFTGGTWKLVALVPGS